MSNALDGAPWLNAMARVFDRAGAPLYLVGGAVRNPLMGLPLSDIDVCGPLKPQDVRALCEGTPVTARLRAAHFGTVELHLTDESGARHMAEYTTFREDSYRCGHRPECVRFTTDIAVDARRRDFSVNALYRRLTGGALGEVIDPTGGLGCLEKGILHTVTPDPDRVLGEDGVDRALLFDNWLRASELDGGLYSIPMSWKVWAAAAAAAYASGREGMSYADVDAILAANPQIEYAVGLNTSRQAYLETALGFNAACISASPAMCASSRSSIWE